MFGLAEHGCDMKKHIQNNAQYQYFCMHFNMDGVSLHLKIAQSIF